MDKVKFRGIDCLYVDGGGVDGTVSGWRIMTGVMRVNLLISSRSQLGPA